MTDVCQNQPPSMSRKLYRKRRKIHHKVKTGCKACKIRHQKCDEQKPVCSGCHRYSTECVYRNRSEKPIFTATISRKNLSISPSTHLNLDDLELVHQWLTSTCIATGQLPEITKYVQMNSLPLGQTYPFVIRGILAMAATHLSWLRPSRQEHYSMIATRNHNDALPEFQSALQNINEKNFSAVISFSKTLLWCTLARDAEDSWLPQWFQLLRGSCHVVEISRAWIKEGPHVRYELDTVDSENPDVRQISWLMSQLPTTNVLGTLREAFARASMHHHNTPVRNAINFWVASLPEEFVELLRKKEQWALVVLAHFCVLIYRFEDLWFMKHAGRRLMVTIIGSLDLNWREYIQWPYKEMGIDWH